MGQAHTPGPFTFHEVWSDQARTFVYEVRHGNTLQACVRYRAHAEANVKSWNALSAARATGGTE